MTGLQQKAACPSIVLSIAI